MTKGGNRVLWQPYPGPQTAFLSTTADEALYGGAVYGGKTDSLLVYPCHRAWHPDHRSILFRRKRLRLQEIIDRARTLYDNVDPKGYWHETELRWKWSTGGFTQFAHAEEERDIEAWKSFEFDLVMFDELTEFTEWQYRFMFMRARSKVPQFAPIVRVATNPGGEGMDWVDKRFIGTQSDGSELFVPYQVYRHTVETRGPDGETVPHIRTRVRIPSSVFDMPASPQRDAYIASLADLPDDEREAYLYGKWGVWQGAFFKAMPRQTKPEFKSSDWYCIRTMDYGYNDPTCILWLIVYPKLSLVEVAAEFYASKQTTDSLVDVILGIESDLRIPADRIVASVMSPDAFKHGPDNSRGIGDLLAEKGAFFTKANNVRPAGWAQVRRMFASDSLRVWESRAPNLLRTLPRLPMDEKKRDDIKQTGVEDHAAEALRYGVMAYYETEPPKEAPKAPTTERIDTQWPDVLKALNGQNKKDPWAGMF